jgi:hypothetical protein
MMLQRFSQRAQRDQERRFLARDARAAYERRQRQSLPRARIAWARSLRLRALKLIAVSLYGRFE